MFRLLSLMLLTTLLTLSTGCAGFGAKGVSAGSWWSFDNPTPEELYTRCERDFLKRDICTLERDCRSFLELYPQDQKSPWIHYYLGMALHTLNRPAQARAELLNAEPEANTLLRSKIYFALADMAMQEKDFARAATYYERLLQMDRTAFDAPFVYVSLIQIYRTGSKPEQQKKADELQKELETKYPGSPHVAK